MKSFTTFFEYESSILYKKSISESENVIDKGYDYIAICSDGAKGTVFHTNSDSIIVDDKIYWTIEGLMEI